MLHCPSLQSPGCTFLSVMKKTRPVSPDLFNTSRELISEVVMKHKNLIDPQVTSKWFDL